MSKVDKLVKRLMQLKTSYYEGKEEVSDSEFDKLEDELRELDPNNEYFNKVGYEIIDNKELVNHIVPMLSMEKVKTPEEARRWMSSLFINNEPGANENRLMNSEWFIQPKIDGNSCTIKYDKNGRFMYMATRGDGNRGFKIKYGEEIMKHNDLPFILYQPNTDDFDLYYGHEIELRGELYINQHQSNVKPPLRNACAGIIKRIDKTQELADISVCLYGIVNNTYKRFISYGEFFPETINQEKTIIPYATKCRVSEIEDIYYKYLNKVRAQLPFETDGLVLLYPNRDIYEHIDKQYKDLHHHHYNMALKPISKASETYIRDIEYNVSKYGTLIPKALLAPIEIDNVTISFVTLSNLDLIQKKGLKIGSKVKIARANDVIPYISEILGEMEGSKPIKQLNYCPVCQGKVYYSQEDKNLVCSNPKCKGKLAAQVSYFCSKMNIKGFAMQSIMKVLNSLHGYQIESLGSFFQVFLKERQSIDNLLGINYEKILVLTLKAFENITLKELIAYGANIPSVGIKTLKDEKIEDLDSWFSKIVNNKADKAWKSKLQKWYNEDDNYAHFIDLYLFITKEKMLIEEMKMNKSRRR